MIVHKDLSDDLVYKMTKAFWDNHAEFVKVKSVWKKVILKTLLMVQQYQFILELQSTIKNKVLCNFYQKGTILCLSEH